jgi:hypothetical protein
MWVEPFVVAALLDPEGGAPGHSVIINPNIETVRDQPTTKMLAC